MQQQNQIKTTIGIVLSSIPGYSETFFRNKIKGLQDNGFEVLLFVDYLDANIKEFPCTVISAVNFKGNLLQKMRKVLLIFFNLFFKNPKRSFKLLSLDKKDGLTFKKRFKHLVLNQFLLTRQLDWLHFGFGMLAVNRENVAKAINAKMAVSFRGYDLYLSPLKHENCYDRLFIKDVQYHVLSNEMKDTLIDYKISSHAIKVITPAIDINLFKTEKTKNNSDDIISIVTVARLHWKKGLVYTFEALAKLKQAGIKFKYTIIGEGSEKERLIFAAHQLDLLNDIIFTGKLSPQDVRNYLENSNIYIQYSIQEGFCNAVLEAQAMGLLCIVSNAEGLSENVLHTKTGWVVPKRKPELLANRIIETNSMSYEEQNLIRERATLRVQKDFNLDKQNKLFLEFYKN